MTELTMPTSGVGVARADAAGDRTAPASYQVEIVDDIGPRWDKQVSGFADAALEQMAAYAVPRWGAARLSGLVLRDAATAEPAAMALAVMATIPLFELGLAYVKFGPLWRRQDRPANPAVLASALMAIKHEFAGERGLVARIMPPAEPDHASAWAQALAGAGFMPHEPADDPDRYLIDLTLPEAEQLASLAPGWRGNLKKALAGGLEIREARLGEALPDFLALYHAMQRRKHFADHHNVWVLPAFARAAAASPGLGVRLFLACHEGRPVAGSMIVGAGDTVFVPFSASDASALSLRAGYALRWWIINELRGTRARWLDLGGTGGDAGLRSFKLGNVGKRGRVVAIPGEFDAVENALSSIVSTMMASTRRWMQKGPVRQLLGTERAGASRA
jgi:hypothetical protein